MFKKLENESSNGIKEYEMKKVVAMKISKWEQETTINFDPVTSTWSIYTCVPSHIKRLLNNPLLQKENLEVLTVYKDKPSSIKLAVPDYLFNSSFLKRKRVLSKEHKIALQNGKNRKVLAS